MRHPVESDACFIIEAVEAIVPSQSGLTNHLEASLFQNAKEELSEEAKEYVSGWTPSNRTERSIMSRWERTLRLQCL